MTTRLQNLKRKTFAKNWIRKASFIYINKMKNKEIAGLFNTLRISINPSDDQAEEHRVHCKKRELKIE
jgi:hypothetical protein